MTPPTPPEPPPPPACADCITTLQSAVPGALPQQSPSRMLRAPDGKMRVDFGQASIITDPAAQKSILLDHVKKEAMAIPAPPQMPQMPQVPPPPLPGAMPAAAMPPKVVELGKALIDGHEVEGKQFTFPPMPKPNLPQKPQIPGLPSPPEPPPMPTVAEVWTSTKTKLPVLTKINGPLGQQICQCKVAEVPPPPPAAFEIPPDYKQVPMPKPPKPPDLQPPQLPPRPTPPRLG